MSALKLQYDADQLVRRNRRKTPKCLFLKSVVQVKRKEKEILVVDPDNPKEVRNFFFDYVYGSDSHQLDIFEETAKPILESVIQGYNGTIFAYGQTGTGKTHTMAGVESDEELKGIIPRTIQYVFDKIKETSGQEFLVRVSFIEIYMEKVKDLLTKNKQTKFLLKQLAGA